MKTLRLESEGGTWADAYINGVKYAVPGAKVKIAAGTYTVRFENRDLHKKFQCQVSVTKDIQSVKVYVEDGECD
jgi:hypothetical protein